MKVGVRVTEQRVGTFAVQAWGPGCKPPAPTEEVSPAMCTWNHITVGGGHRLAGLAVFQPRSKFSERACPKEIRQEMTEQDASVPSVLSVDAHLHTHTPMHTLICTRTQLLKERGFQVILELTKQKRKNMYLSYPSCSHCTLG